MGFLTGKRALIVGVASNRSIAYGIAKAMHREGAELAFTYQTDKLKSRVQGVAEECDSSIVLPLDVADDAQIDTCFAELAARNLHEHPEAGDLVIAEHDKDGREHRLTPAATEAWQAMKNKALKM